MKTYTATRTDHGVAVVVEDNGECRGLDPRHDLHTLSREGFDWGDRGSGSEQLALALAADVLGDDKRALGVHMRLKFKFIGNLPDEGWTLTEDRIRAAIEAIEQKQELVYRR